MVNKITVLAIVAHPDDAEITCGGTLAKYCKKGHEVYICHVTDGSKGSLEHSSEEIAKIRREESIESAKVIGANSIWGGFIDGEVVLDLKSRIKMIDIIRKVNPDIIFTHSPNDYHSDHINISRLVFEATYLVGIKLWKTEYESTDKVPILYYMDNVAGIDFIPSEYVDISETIDEKVKMMSKMKSQLSFLRKMHDTDAEEFIKTVARYRGFQSGVTYAEAFTQQKKFPVGLIERILP